MSDDLPELEIAAPEPIAQPGRAEVRPGPHYFPPHATDSEWDRYVEDELDVSRAIQTARGLLRRARHATQDAMWPGVSSMLADAAALLRSRIRRIQDDPHYACTLERSWHDLNVIERLRRGQRA